MTVNEIRDEKEELEIVCYYKILALPRQQYSYLEIDQKHDA